ncbi:hypothetical protein [Halopseudomonas xiamenensis]|uniref:hypothetical protein n=1 Tax=Halopseudomonas xiamenensis TaxID=157792 RepID=UPI0016293F58|nr:hypothetical protein [Halopseudomonas xiamenensis]
MSLNLKRNLWVALSSIFFVFVILNLILMIKVSTTPDAPEVYRDHNSNTALQERKKILDKGILYPEDLVEIDRLWSEAVDVIKKENDRLHAESVENRAKHMMQPAIASIMAASLIWLIFLVLVRPTPKEIIFPQLLVFIVLSTSFSTIFESIVITVLSAIFLVSRRKDQRVI